MRRLLLRLLLGPAERDLIVSALLDYVDYDDDVMECDVDGVLENTVAQAHSIAKDMMEAK
jgi:hypothetical protein